MKRFIAGLLICVITIISCSCSDSNGEFTRTSYALGTVISLTTIGTDAQKANEVIDMALTRIAEIEQACSVNVENSELNRLNKSAYDNEVEVSDTLYAVLRAAIDYSRLTDGAIDVTIGKLIKLWNIDGSGDKSVPSKTDIDKLKGLSSWQNVVIDDISRTVHFTSSNVMVNLGSAAKGYAADEVKRIFLENGVESGIINLGGNISLVGLNGGKNWRVGVKNPQDTSKVSAIVTVSSQTVVTSGSYERFFEVDGERYHHILDPQTGYPAKSGLLSVTVIASSSLDADCLSTAAFVMGAERAVELFEELDGVEGVFITDDMEIITTSGMNEDNFEAAEKK